MSKTREQSPIWNEYELAGGVIVPERFREKIQGKIVEARRPKRGRPKK